MPRIDKIVEPMSQGNHAEAVLLSDSPLRLKSDEGKEELSVSLTHRQITSMVEEILPSALFTDLVMMKPVEFTYRHPAGVLDIKVVPGDSLWRVIIKAPQGLDPFRTSKSRSAVPDEKFQVEDSENWPFVDQEQEDEVVDEEVSNDGIDGERSMDEGIDEEEVGDERAVGEGAVDEEISNEVIPNDKVVNKDVVDEDVVDEDVVDEDVVDKDVVDKDVVDEDVVDEDVVDKDVVDEDVVDEDVVDEDVVDKDVVDKDVVDEDVVDKDVVDEDVVDEDVVDKDVVDEDVVDEDVVDEDVVNKDVVDEDVVDEDVVDEKAVGEAVVDKGAVAEEIMEEFAIDKEVLDQVAVDERAVGETQEGKEKEYSKHVSPKPAPVAVPETKHRPGPKSKPRAEHCFTQRARGLTLEGTPECDELIERAKIAKSGTLLLIPGQRAWVYGPQGYTPMAGARSPVTDDLLCALLEKNEAAASCSNARHALRTIYGERKESSYIRCTLTQNRDCRTAVFRIPLVDPSHPSHIGLPPHTSELLSEGGVLLTSSPRGGGRTTTAFVIGSSLMSSGHQLGLSIGRPIERKLIVSAPNFSFDMSHKEILRGVMLAQDLGASVVVLDDGPPTSIEKALRLAEMGIAVVFTIQADSAMGALFRSLGHIKKWKKQIPRLSRLLKGVIYQELIWTKESNRSPVFERLLPDNTLLEAMAREQWDLLGGKRGDSVTSPSFAESLKALAENGVIDRHTADKHRHNS